MLIWAGYNMGKKYSYWTTILQRSWAQISIIGVKRVWLKQYQLYTANTKIVDATIEKINNTDPPL